MLVDTAGRVVAGALTDSNGRFHIRTGSSGRYRVRARRIGFSPDSSAVLELRQGSSVAFDPTLSPFATPLQGMRVSIGSRCAAPTASPDALRLWQETLSALTATVVSSDRPQTGFVLRHTERVLDPASGAVRQGRSWDVTTVNSESYRSIPAESLAVHGFVVPLGADLVYYAPDARTLISDAFAHSHCYSPREDAKQPNLIGLAFSPSGNSGVRDVSGVLWLDKRSGELRFLSYRYDGPSAQADTNAVASGRVEYSRLSDGSWVVSHWVIRMPVLSKKYTLSPSAASDPLAPGSTLTRRETLQVAAIWESSGNVLRTFNPRDSAESRPSAVGEVDGRFVDSARSSSVHRGVAGIRVTLSREESTVAASREGGEDSIPITRSAVTDTSGTFNLAAVPPGDYVVHASSARLDTLGVAISAREVHVAASSRQSLLTVLPPVSDAVSAMCGRGTDLGKVLLHGAVHDGATGAAVPDARITVSWFDLSNIPGHFSARTQNRAVVTGSDGQYVMCGLPAGRSLTVAGTLGMRQFQQLSLAPSDALIRMLNLRTPQGRLSATGLTDVVSATHGERINGVVRDTMGHGIAGASVRLDDAAWMHVDDHGAFALVGVSAGRHVLTARAIGFDSHAWYVSVRADRAASAPLTLLRVTRLDAVTVTAAADTTRLDPTGFTTRRLSNAGGTFVDRQQIDRRGAQRVTEVLRGLPGVVLVPVSDRLGGREFVIEMRGPATATDRMCPIQYYVDGHPFAAPGNIDRLVAMRDVAGIEVYSDASQVPAQFKGPTSRCGVIAIWTLDSTK
ncbi:MAG: Plug and carboxypeptidase regulatory-like domain-containing protein [Gemmatimonadota bacterium]|nr:Plug and carboxypeptidase regulatory-like domain-containing protein [Gemmatimonadota bacterium]